MVYKEVWVFIRHDQDPGEVLRQEIRRFKMLYPHTVVSILKFKPDMADMILNYATSGISLEDVPPQFRSAVSVLRRYGVKTLPSVGVTYTNGWNKLICEGVSADGLIACVGRLYAKRAHLLRGLEL